MNITIFLILAFATWRLADILIVEDGPWGIVLFIRTKLAMQKHPEVDSYEYKETMLGQLFQCIRCMSVWVAGFWTALYFVLPDTWFYVIAFPFAFSGMAILIDTWVYKGYNSE